MSRKFRFDKVPKGAVVNMQVPMAERDLVVSIVVTHTFEFDSLAALLEKYHARTALLDRKSAALSIWEDYCVEVSGYEGIPTNFKKFFLENEMGQEHASRATTILTEKLVIKELRQP